MAESTNTVTVTQQQSNISGGNSPILKLRSDNENTSYSQNQVRFSQETIDNEHMNKKKTKICCIYHPDDEEDTCDHDHSLAEQQKEDEAGTVSSDEEDGELSYDQRRAKRIERRKKQLLEQENGAYVPPNSYEIQPDYSGKKAE